MRLRAVFAAIIVLDALCGCGSFSAAPHAGATQDVRIAAWNMKWFPAGHPVLLDKDRRPQSEFKRIDSAARFIAWQQADLVMLEEVRNRDACEMLCAQEALAGWSVDSITEFPQAEEATIPPHQNAIISRYAAVDSGWRHWKAEDGITPPRGFVYAVYDFNGTLCAVIGVHLKSNYIPDDSPDKDRLPALNRRMREISSRQIAEFVRELEERDFGGRKVSEVIVAGDFNTSVFDPKYDGERTVPQMLGAGFRDCFDGVVERDTMPESKWYPATCFDYMFAKGPAGFYGAVVAPTSWTSDHRMISAVFSF